MPAMPDLKGLLDTISNAAKLGLNAGQPAPPEKLFHFTDTVGLLGIVGDDMSQALNCGRA